MHEGISCLSSGGLRVYLDADTRRVPPVPHAADKGEKAGARPFAEPPASWDFRGSVPGNHGVSEADGHVLTFESLAL